MRIAFLDPVGWDYDIDTPLTQPLGGSQSALCYLAAEFAALGHDVTLINHIATRRESQGVVCLPWSEATNMDLNQADVVIVSNAGKGSRLRMDSVRAPLVLWTGHPHTQRAVQRLQNAEERDAWTGFAFVSSWQCENYVKSFAIPPQRVRVLHNGIGRPFAEQEPLRPWFLQRSAPVLAYTSVPSRGLNVLLNAFPAIQVAFPDARLRVYSNMSIYRIPPEKDPFRALYHRSQQMHGVEYVGPVSQTQLAGELANTAIIAYPATVAETFCLAIAEGMALGASIITTRLGAIPELYGEFPRMLEISDDRARLAEEFGSVSVDAIRSILADPDREYSRRKTQIEFIRSRYCWSLIAPQWLIWLDELLGSGR